VKSKLHKYENGIQLSDKESQFYKATNRHFEEIMAQVKFWLEPLDEILFMERDPQKVLDAMKGLGPAMKLITLLPTEKLQKKFHETIENYLKAKFKEKRLSKDEMEYLIVRKLLELTNPNSEYDILFFQKETSTVYHFEFKAMMIGRNDGNSLYRL